MALLGQRIQSLRKEAELTQNELASKLGISKSSIGMYEIGQREPDSATLELIADFFNVDMDYLYGKSGIKNRNNLAQAFAASTVFSSEAQRLARIYDNLLNANGQEEMRNHTDYIASQDKYKKDNLADEFSEEIS